MLDTNINIQIKKFENPKLLVKENAFCIMKLIVQEAHLP